MTLFAINYFNLSALTTATDLKIRESLWVLAPKSQATLVIKEPNPLRPHVQRSGHGKFYRLSVLDP